MALTVTVLGCSGSYAAPDNPCTGYLLRSEEAVVLLDCGPGTLGPLQTAADLNEITAVVITHCHPDHWLELPVIRNVFTWFHPRHAVPVYGTLETRTMDAALGAQSVKRSGRDDPMAWSVIDASSDFRIGDQHWRFAQTNHPVETLAVRVDCQSRSFAFSADTGPGWDFRSLGQGIHLAMCEASYGKDRERQSSPHISAREAARAASVAGVERLVLTHMSPGSDPEARLAEARAEFDGEVDAARPGLVFTV